MCRCLVKSVVAWVEKFNTELNVDENVTFKNPTHVTTKRKPLFRGNAAYHYLGKGENAYV